MHSHIGKVVEWKVSLEGKWKPTWGCTDCDETFDSNPSEKKQEQEHTHTEYVDGCFACKLSTVQLDTGDANSKRAMSKSSNDKELALYREARKQGIQPDSTKTADIRKAIDISNKTGHAYGSKIKEGN